MALASGSKLGPYEVLSPAGAGGMGEVYRARDTRLDRTVAIKVLPGQYSKDPELRQRFEREARAISSLNHPNICHLYDVGHQDGTDYLVLEFIEGESLDDRLRKGPLPTEILLSTAIEIAEALETAHRNGIIHRDLKPSNVMLTSSGAKLLDFGLAKPAGMSATAGGDSAPLLSAAVTTTSPSPQSPLTGQGTIIGTIQYMSPEQIEGKEADARSDIFAFGAMLYEMTTGERAFTGKSQISVASAILDKDPEPISRRSPASPAVLDRIVRTCLAKSPEGRFQCAADVRIQLQWVREAQAEPEKSPALGRAVSRGRKSLLGWGMAALLTVLGSALAGLHYRTAHGPLQSVHAYILPPDKSAFVLTENHAGPPVISPDGTRIAFTARTTAGQLMLWVQPLNSSTPQALSGTVDAYYPFWSADSKYLGFFMGGKLYKVEASGGPPQALCDANDGRGGAWNDAGSIIFARTSAEGLMRVDAAGGAPVPLTELGPTETSHRWPAFLSDGRHFIYFAHAGIASDSGVYLASLDSKERKLLLHNESNAIFAPPGYLLFVRDNSVMVQRFSPEKLALEGDAHPVAAHVVVNTDTWRGIVTASANGLLLYYQGEGAIGSELWWFSRNGVRGDKVLPESAIYLNPSLSPDGRKLAVSIEMNGNRDIWVVDLDRKTKTRVTFGPDVSNFPVWSQDGRFIVFSCGLMGQSHLCQKAADGTGGVEKLEETAGVNELPSSISADGRYVAYMRSAPQSKTGWDIWALPLFGDRKPFSVVSTQFLDSSPAISPNGKWIAYHNNESGRFEVYLQSFPGGAGRWQVSTGGGVRPQWRRDGKELFFRSLDGELTAVDVRENEASPVLSSPHALFKFNAGPSPTGPYTVFPNGTKFIANVLSIQLTNEPLTLVTNWTTNLTR